jgi:hypothetical protein
LTRYDALSETLQSRRQITQTRSQAVRANPASLQRSRNQLVKPASVKGWPCLVAVSGLGLSAAVAASNDTWKGAWKLEFPPPRDQPSLSYYDTNGKTVFRLGCRTHYEIECPLLTTQSRHQI